MAYTRFAQWCSNLWKSSHFSACSRLGLFLQVFGQVNEWVILKLYEMIGVQHIFTCPVVFSLLCDLSWSRGVLKPISSTLSRLGPFPQVFEHVKDWPILGLHEMIKVPHTFAFSIVFSFLCDLCCHEQALEHMKNDQF